MKTLKETLEEAILALEAAQSGLQWYQDMYPEEVDGSDDEANLQIETAIKDLQAVVAQQDAQAVPQNPYAAQGSLAEAWQRGYEGRPMLASSGSNYARVYREGKRARIGKPHAASPGEKR